MCFASSVGAISFAPGSALAQTCLELGGRQYCGSPQPGNWVVSPCDEAGAFLSRAITWCNVAGGVWTATSDCVGDTPHTDDNVVARSIEFANRVRSSTCSVTNDTGYGATYTTNFCLGGGNAFQAGQLWITSRRLTILCESGAGETISIDKRRPFSCPVGYTPTSIPFYGTLCARTLENCGDCKVGNPVTPLTGIKIETESDYRHPLGLEFTRHYHSLRFFEPYSTTNGSHSENRLGVVWRSGFDKRVIPLTPASTLTHTTLRQGLTLPSGEVQYFNAAGVQQYNYGGPASSITAVAGVGFFHKGPDSTEFYGTDGRLRTITQRSGQVLTLTYSDGTTGPNGGFILNAAGNPTALVLPANRLIRVTDSYGNALSFGQDINGRIVVMTVPGGNRYFYAYDGNDNLTGVTYPDGRVRSYRYNEPANIVGGGSLPNALTTIVDENLAEFASFKYDTSNRAVSTERAGGAQRYEPDRNHGSD
jgi:YD repeat-containing protein